MDRLLAIFGQPDDSVRPELLIVYGAAAVLVSVFVNWTLSALLFILKPFTCAAILMAFIRPDLAQNFIQGDSIIRFIERSKDVFLGLTNIVLRLGEKFHEKFN